MECGIAMKDAEELLSRLIQIPSENNGITGYEEQVLQFYHSYLASRGIPAQIYYPEEIPGFADSPECLKEHSLHRRPAVVAQIVGKRPGKTILLLAHADTVPVGDLSQWHDSPFSGKIADGRLYGRGSGDDKWGMATMSYVAQELMKRDCDFAGTVIIAAVGDEESGGGNGTLSVFANGITADEAIYLDGGSNQTIWHAGLGGGLCKVFGEDKEKIRDAILAEKDRIRQRISAHPCFGENFFPIIASQFYQSRELPNGIAWFMDVLPGEDEEQLKADFERLLPGCTFQWISRFLKPAYVPQDSALVTGLADAFEQVTGRRPEIGGGIQSDQGLVMHYGKVPCILFGCGRRGMEGASHLPDEYIEISRFEEVSQSILEFVLSQP